MRKKLAKRKENNSGLPKVTRECNDIKDEELDDILERIDPSNKTPTFFRKPLSDSFKQATPMSLWEIFVTFGLDTYQPSTFTPSSRVRDYNKIYEKMLGMQDVLAKPWDEWEDTEDMRSILKWLENHDFLGVSSLSSFPIQMSFFCVLLKKWMGMKTVACLTLSENDSGLTYDFYMELEELFAGYRP